MGSVSHKWHFVECKQSYLERWVNIQYLLEGTAWTVGNKALKKKIF